MNAGPSGVDLPDIRVVGLNQLVLHEGADQRRTELLRQQLAVDQRVKNPPVVASLDDDRFVVLDGANRTSALRAIGVPDVVVQVVDYEDVSLSTWFHLVAGLAPEELVAAVRDVDGAEVAVSDLPAARQALADRRIVAYFIEPDGTVHPIGQAGEEVPAVDLLNRVVATYKGRADIYRVQSDEIEDLLPFYAEIAALVVFPEYQPDDIVSLAGRQVKLPTGITRHVIPRRALRLNTELSFLWSDTPLSEKNRWLFEWTRHKLQAGQIRFYEESTFLFDE